MSALKVGDVCQIIHNGGRWTELELRFVGASCTLVEFSSERPTPIVRRVGYWRVSGAGGPPDLRVWVAEDCLRKIDPPDDSRKVVRWDQCPWQPAEVSV